MSQEMQAARIFAEAVQTLARLEALKSKDRHDPNGCAVRPGEYEELAGYLYNAEIEIRQGIR